MLTGIAKPDFGKHVAIPSEVTGSASYDDVVHARFTAARMHNDVVVL